LEVRNELLALSAATVEQLKQKQLFKLKQVIGEISPQEKHNESSQNNLMLRQFWATSPDEDVPF
jgi:hypothetical protein